MLRKALLWAALLVALLALAPAAAAGGRAQDGTPPPAVSDDDVNAVAKKLYCPVCENIPLDVCPTQACIQWRGTIREKLAAGWSEPAILQYFVDYYGEWVLAEPTKGGINVVLWVLPPLAVVAGGIFLWRYLRSAARPAAPAAPEDELPEPEDEYAQQLERELRKRL